MVQYDWRRSIEPSVALVETVAAATGLTATELPPINRSIDPDALDVLLTGDQSSIVSLSFRYADTIVTMKGDGTIELQVDGQPTERDAD